MEIRNVGRTVDILVWPGKYSLRGKFGVNPERCEETSHLDIRRKGIPGWGSSECKGLALRSWLVFSWKAEAEWTRERGVGEDLRQETRRDRGKWYDAQQVLILGPVLHLNQTSHWWAWTERYDVNWVLTGSWCCYVENRLERDEDRSSMNGLEVIVIT